MCVQAAGSVKSDLRRLATFASCRPLTAWSSVSCVRLANRGFIYAGNSDNLVCQRCGVVLSGWLGTQRNPAVEHRCPCPSTTTDDLPVSEVSRDYHDSTIYATYIAVLQRAARNGVLRPAETLALASDTRRESTPSYDDVTSGDTATSEVSDDANVLTLKLSLAKRRRSLIHYCRWCVWCWWWQHMGIWPRAPAY